MTICKMKVSNIFLLIFIIYSCGKDNKDSIETDKYLIEMNSEYRFSKVTHIIDNNNTVEFEKSYEYSDKYVKIQIKDGSLSTYYLNQIGLADSCLENGTMMQYHYDQNNFLTSYSYPSGSVAYYGYGNGNRITFRWGLTKADYQYNSQINIIDIDHFHGTYLGKINKNLIAAAKLQFPMAGNALSLAYQYTLNSAGLVIQRIMISTPASGASPRRTITKFEYVIK